MHIDIGNPIERATQPANTLPKLPDGTTKSTTPALFLVAAK